MTLILNRNTHILFVVLCAVALLAWPGINYAQSTQSIAVTPTLFEMSAVRGQVWQSSVKVVNSNQFPLTVFATPVNFAPQGEAGQGKLIPILDGATEGATLAEWITVTEDSIEVPAEQSREISFLVEVPEDAPPGGHFAAILVGTQPPTVEEGTMQLSTSQVVSSLFFLRIAGDVIENGAIRSFTTTEKLVPTPQAAFELRFENKGNVHLQPRGSIEIYNMWGSNRGNIPINHQTNFGNVLPNSIRQFVLRFEGESSFTDIGRYRADVALAYGVDGRQFVTDSTYFWVLPIKSALLTAVFAIAFVWFVLWGIKAYIRRMLTVAGVDPYQPRRQRKEAITDHDIDLASYKSVSAPVRSGWRDLVGRMTAVSLPWDKFLVMFRFVRGYWKFFLGVTLLIFGIMLIVWFIRSATGPTEYYKVAIDNQGTQVELDSEEIAFERLLKARGLKNQNELQTYGLAIHNTSGVAETAAGVATELVAMGLEVSALQAEPERRDARTVIVFDTDLQEEALAISRLLDGALLSAREPVDTDSQPILTIYVGADRVSE